MRGGGSFAFLGRPFLCPGSGAIAGAGPKIYHIYVCAQHVQRFVLMDFSFTRASCYNAPTMVITYQGGQCFKVVFGDTTIAFDPISKKSDFTAVKFGADAAFVSLNHPNFNGTEEVAFGSKEPFVVHGPGEYEIGEVTARGYGVKTTYDGKECFNTIYQVGLEGINMVFLGALADADIDPKILSEFGDIDILFVPIGGGDVLDVPAAAKLATKLEAHAIIPMHYDSKALGVFLKEMGIETKAEEKLTVKKKDLLIMEGQVVVLKS